ncbi:MAG: glycine cleavage system aminomethyltransferase GcvT [Cyanobacteria bacterium P01_F01_bin.153]
METSLFRTPLYDAIVATGAKMTEFGGWEMPVQFAGLKAEHEAVRSSCGVFDISHMGKFALSGSSLMNALQRLVPTDLSILTPGRGKYTVLLNEAGGILDDLIVYWLLPENGIQRAIAIVNAATTIKDRSWLLQNMEGCSLEDLGDRVLLAVQGPEAEAQLQKLVAADLSQVKFYRFVETEIAGQPAFIARTGYTGEDGFEVMLAAEAGVHLWQALLDAGVTPCGLGARDTLRLEAAMALYGQDVDESTTPFEASLDWLIHLDRKGDFIGRKSLEAQQEKGVPRRLVGLQLSDRNIARHDYPVLHNGETVGTVTSGTLSPTLGTPIAIAHVPAELSEVGQKLSVQIRKKTVEAVVCDRPFYRRQK